MNILHPTRRLLRITLPLFALFVLTVLYVTSVIADGGTTTPRVGSEKVHDTLPAAIITHDLTTGITPSDLVNTLVGSGVTISNVTYIGADTAAGLFSGGTGIIGFEDGIILSSGDMNDVVGPNQSNTTTTQQFTPGDLDLEMLSGFPTFDATVLEFDFVSNESQVFFQFVFGSEEYNEFVGQDFNDVFGFFVNGQNCALVENDPISVNTIHNGPDNQGPGSHPELFRNNDLEDGGGTIDTEADGLTVVLTCNAAVVANGVNHMKLAIADATDRLLDSWVLLQADSLTTEISITLGPDPGQGCVGTPHTLVATIADVPPIDNKPVFFEIVSGPNTGALGFAFTNSDGQATFSYTSPVVGTDVARASFVGSDNQLRFSDLVDTTWIDCTTPTPTATQTSTATPTPTITPSPSPSPTATGTPAPTNCTYTIGYWKDNPGQWPANSLTLGGITYNQTGLLDILNTPPQGDASYILIYQLMGVSFNILQGADSSAIITTLNSADAWLVANPLGSNPGGAVRQQGIALAQILDDYNQGIIGPGQCQQPPPTCTEPVLYGVHDGAGSDSQFFDLNLWFGLVSPLGPPHPDADFESMDIHPQTGEMYTIAGGGGNIDGQAYRVDKLTGELTFLGETGVVGSDEIVDIAFHPDGTLWMFQEDEGLFTIEITGDLSSTFIWNPAASGFGSDWEGLAWDRFGNELYAADDRDLYRWDPVTQTAVQLCGDDFLPGETEALDFRDDGALVGGSHDAFDLLTVFVIDYDACTIAGTDYGIEYNDVEALAFDACIPQGSISGYVADEQGLPVAGVEVRLVAAGSNRLLESLPAFASQTGTLEQDDVFISQISDANGRYHFEQLPADLYAVILGEANFSKQTMVSSFPYTVRLAPGEMYEHKNVLE